MKSVFEKILIPGGGGMLAKALVDALHARGHSSIALPRAALDITNEADIRRAFAEHRPTLVLNCAAHTKVDLCEDEPDKADAINGHAVGTLAKLARDHGTYLVHYSTDFVFDGSSDRPYRPSDPVNPLSAYGRSKLLGEIKLQENAPQNWLIARTAWLYGPGGPCFPKTMVDLAKAGKPLKVVEDQIGSPTFTYDLASATLDLLGHNATGIWHLTNSGLVSWHGFAAAILEEFGLKTDLTPTTSAEWQKLRPRSAHRPAYSVLDNRLAANLLGRPMRPWREGLRDYRQVDNSP